MQRKPQREALNEHERRELAALFDHVKHYAEDYSAIDIDPLTYVALDGDTCLHIAAGRNEVRALELLLKAGLDVDVRGDMDQTPLHNAVMAQADEAEAFLRKHGASDGAVDAFGRTPRQWKSGS